MRTRCLAPALVLVSALLGIGCGTAPTPRAVAAPPATPAPATPYAEPSAPRDDAPAAELESDLPPAPPKDAAPSYAPPAGGAAPARPEAATADESMPAPASQAKRSAGAEWMPAPRSRPGLGTSWGETRVSHVESVPFVRIGDAPSAMARVRYNDREGARAMVAYEGEGAAASWASVDAGGVVVSLRDERGATLPAYRGERGVVAIGAPGRRYTIVLTNHTPRRIEAVASVDGLDVLDGQAASPGKRGYLLPPWGSVSIDGFRKSDNEVAAFRFGSVRDSYAARTGQPRNVGVIGVALFDEQRPYPTPWTQPELERRETADPFPGRYAPPPPPRAW